MALRNIVSRTSDEANTRPRDYIAPL